MTEPLDLELIPEQKAQSKRFFDTWTKYEEFCRNFVEEVRPELERQREARQQSEAEAKQRWTR